MRLALWLEGYWRHFWVLLALYCAIMVVSLPGEPFFIGPVAAICGLAYPYLLHIQNNHRASIEEEREFREHVEQRMKEVGAMVDHLQRSSHALRHAGVSAQQAAESFARLARLDQSDETPTRVGPFKQGGPVSPKDTHS